MMRVSQVILLTAMAAVPLAVLANQAPAAASRQVSVPDAQLRSASSFASIPDADQRSVALFREMGKVIESPRCLNCHPRTDRPNQGDGMAPHMPAVVRGKDGRGAAGLECATCHGPDNVDFANGSCSIPGSRDWHLAPRSMAWEGRSLREICIQLKDTARNGGKTLEDLVAHNAHDELVGWAWNPGKGRKPAPGSQAEFGALTRAWVDSGAKCPA